MTRTDTKEYITKNGIKYHDLKKDDKYSIYNYKKYAQDFYRTYDFRDLESLYNSYIEAIYFIPKRAVDMVNEKLFLEEELDRSTDLKEIVEIKKSVRDELMKIEYKYFNEARARLLKGNTTPPELDTTSDSSTASELDKASELFPILLNKMEKLEFFHELTGYEILDSLAYLGIIDTDKQQTIND